MAIPVNGFQDGALAALAGRGTPNLNLPLHSITGGDFFTKMVEQQNSEKQMAAQQQVADANTLRANNEMPIAQMQQQGQNARAAADNALQQQQINILLPLLMLMDKLQVIKNN